MFHPALKPEQDSQDIFLTEDERVKMENAAVGNLSIEILPFFACFPGDCSFYMLHFIDKIFD
jgi:hypothetical protein